MKMDKRARIIDFHSHLLPAIDDGSKDIAMSLEILQETRRQKVRKIVATPHFYPEEMSLSRFLEKRERAVEKVLSVFDSSTCPRVYLGAETGYFRGIGDSDEISQLTIVGTNTILVEMPFRPWSEATVEDIISLSIQRGLNVILAHIERYRTFFSDRTMDRLLSSGIYIQSNAEFFLDKEKEKDAMDMLSSDRIHILGSDVHNTGQRRQRIGEARDKIRETLGEETMERILETSRFLLSGALSIDEI